MNLSDTLMQYAIESGEIDPDLSDLLDTEDGTADEETAELVEAKADEIMRANDLVESLEAVADRYSQIPVSDISFENYQFTIGQLLAVSGLDIPVSVIAPSFESAEKTEGQSFKDKAKGAIAAIIKWIREKFQALVNFIKRRKPAQDKKAEEEGKKAEEACAAAKKDGVVEIQSLAHKPRQGYAPGQHEGDEKPSPKHGDQNGERASMPKHAVDADGKATGKAKIVGTGSIRKLSRPIELPVWLVTGGKLDLTRLKGFADNGNATSSADLAKRAMAYNDVAKIRAEVNDGKLEKIQGEVRGLLDEYSKRYTFSKTTGEWRASLHDLEQAIGYLIDADDHWKKYSAELTKIIEHSEGELRTMETIDWKYKQHLLDDARRRINTTITTATFWVRLAERTRGDIAKVLGQLRKAAELAAN